MKVFENDFTESLKCIEIESTVEWPDDDKLTEENAKARSLPYTEGIMINEGIIPETGVSVRVSQPFTCLKSADREYFEASDFDLKPTFTWELFYNHHICDNDERVLSNSEIIRLIVSNTKIMDLNPMLLVD